MPMAHSSSADQTMQTIRVVTDSDGVATIWLDQPGKAVNTLTPLMLEELFAAITSLEASRPSGLIFASPKARSFVAGADLFEIRKMNREQVEAFLATGQKLFDRIAHLPFPTVAAINGDCLGGGLELALACQYRVASEEGSINIGLPEVKLGILPGWGGTVRLPRLIGLASALPMLLAGKTMPPKKARKAGIVDDVVRPEALQSAAKRWARGDQPIHKPSFAQRSAARLPYLRDRIFAAAKSQTEAQSFGNYPAPLRLIDVVRTGYERGEDAGFEAERNALGELRDTRPAQNLIRLFFLRQGAKKSLTQRISAKPREVKHAAVLGGGTMGAGIIHGLIRAGVSVRLIEVNPNAVSGALGRIRKLLDDDVASGKLSALDSRHAFNRVAPTTAWTGMELMDLVIEAVVEKMEVKRDVFAKLDKAVREDCVLATNTSSLSVSEMAQATVHPNRVVGLHFFNPVPKMPLVEVVRGKESDDQSLATAAALAIRMGKTPVLTSDSPGFLVNRVLIPYLAEAIAVASEGTPITTIDLALKRWGMPMGPIELLDEIGLDVSDHVLKSLGGQMSGRVPQSAILDEALKRGWLGKKSAKGFYIHDGSRKKRETVEVNEELGSILCAGRAVPANQVAEQKPSNEELDAIAWRVVLPMANEAARVLEEHVVDSVDDVDLATVMGTGLAPFRGGLAHFIDAVGIAELKSRLEEATRKFGPRFAPAPLIDELAAAHLPLADFQKLHHEEAVSSGLH